MAAAGAGGWGAAAARETDAEDIRDAYRSALATIRASYLLGYRPPPAPTAAVAERRWREIGVGLADSRHRHRLVHRAGALR